MKTRMFRLTLAIFAAAGIGASAPLVVQYQRSILEGAPDVDQGLPVALSQDPNNVRFRYFVPDFASLVSINSLTASVNISDPSSNGFEQGALLFVLNGIGQPNVEMDSFSGGVPLILSGSLTGGDLTNALLEIQGDGVFFIRVNRDGNNRDGNDFLVSNPIVTIDGELSAAPVPEPATLAPMAATVLAMALRLRGRFRAK